MVLHPARLLSQKDRPPSRFLVPSIGIANEQVRCDYLFGHGMNFEAHHLPALELDNVGGHAFGDRDTVARRDNGNANRLDRDEAVIERLSSLVDVTVC